MLAFALFGALGWVVTGQLFSLANKLPEYGQNLQTNQISVEALGEGGQELRNR
jgi:hypothetical protein